MKRYEIVTYADNGMGFNERMDYATQKEALARYKDYRTFDRRTDGDPSIAIFDRLRRRYIHMRGPEKWRFDAENERLAKEARTA